MSTVDVGPGWGPAGNGFALGQAICTTILPIVGLSMRESLGHEERACGAASHYNGARPVGGITQRFVRVDAR